MPLYAYSCPNGHTVEVIEKVSERLHTKGCLACLKDGIAAMLTRDAGAPGFSIKGYNAQNGYAAPQCGSGGCGR